MRRKQPTVRKKTSEIMSSKETKGHILPVLPLPEEVMFPAGTRAYHVTRKQRVAAVRHAIETNGEILLLTMKETVDNPKREHLYEIGTLGKVLQWVDPKDGTIKIFVSGTARAQVLDFFEDEAFPKALVRVISEKLENDPVVQALVNNLVSILEGYVGAAKQIPTEVAEGIKDFAAQNDPVQLTDMIARHLPLDFRVQQEVLEVVDPKARLEKLIEVLTAQVQIHGIENRSIKTCKEFFGNNQDFRLFF